MKTLEEISKDIPNDWWDKLERAKLQEQGRRKIYERHYADKMTYDRFNYIGFLEAEIVMGHLCEEKAREMLNKYDEYHGRL